MPKVPEYSNFQTVPSGQPNVQFQNPSGPTPGAIAADQAAQFGQAATRTGEAFGKIALEAMEQANQVRNNDALNKARAAAQDLAFNPNTGFRVLKGDNALTRPDGKPLDQEYGDKLKGQLDTIRQGLGNDAQRRAFDMQAGGLLTQFRGQVQSHQLGEFMSHADAVSDGTIALSADGIKKNYNDAEYVFGRPDPATGKYQGGAIDALKGAIMEKMTRAGLRGDPAEKALLAGVSQAHTGAIMAALENNNPQYAMSYMDKTRKAGELSGDDILKLQGHVNLAVDQRISQSAVKDQTTAAIPVIAPNYFDKMVQITAQSESGGRETNPDGTTVTSPKGAQGIMQVMPATNKDPGFGVKPAQDDSPGERARVGRDYLQSLMQRYGDPAKAWAAYNAGPGTLDKALKESAAGRSGSGDWLNYMPRETQAYVAKNTAALQGSGPVAPRPTELDFVNGALARLPEGASPQAVKFTRDAAVSQFNLINKSITEQGDNALAQAQRWIVDNKGTTVQQMPPALLDTLNRFAPGKVDDLYKFSKTLEKGDVVTNTALYLKLSSDPKFLTGLSNDQFMQLRSELSESDFKAFEKERVSKLQGGGANGPGELNGQAIKDTLDARLRILKIDPTPKDGSDDAVHIGAVHKFVRDEVAEAQRAAGKKFTDVETARFIDGLFARNVKFKGFFGGSDSKALLAMKPSDVPSEVSNAIKKDFAARGNPNPTDADIYGVYLRLRK